MPFVYFFVRETEHNEKFDAEWKNTLLTKINRDRPKMPYVRRASLNNIARQHSDLLLCSQPRTTEPVEEWWTHWRRFIWDGGMFLNIYVEWDVIICLYCHGSFFAKLPPRILIPLRIFFLIPFRIFFWFLSACFLVPGCKPGDVSRERETKEGRAQVRCCKN